MRYTEHVVMKAADLAEGAMRQVEVGPVVILVARVGGKFYAVGGTCPHYGAPLAEGVLSGGRVVCPWHQSHFCVATGKMLEPPTLDDLPRYEVRLEGEDVVVRVPAAWCDRVAPAVARPLPQADGRTFLILGAGAAGLLAAQTLREAGFRGRVVLAGPERHLPYDRPGLSKNYLAAVPLDSALPLREMPFYLERGIELRRGRATAVDLAARAVTFDEGPAESYDALLIATGGRPRRLEVPGADLKGVLMLRTLGGRQCAAGRGPAGDAGGGGGGGVHRHGGRRQPDRAGAGCDGGCARRRAAGAGAGGADRADVP